MTITQVVFALAVRAPESPAWAFVAQTARAVSAAPWRPSQNEVRARGTDVAAIVFVLTPGASAPPLVKCYDAGGSIVYISAPIPGEVNVVPFEGGLRVDGSVHCVTERPWTEGFYSVLMAPHGRAPS